MINGGFLAFSSEYYSFTVAVPWIATGLKRLFNTFSLLRQATFGAEQRGFDAGQAFLQGVSHNIFRKNVNGWWIAVQVFRLKCYKSLDIRGNRLFAYMERRKLEFIVDRIVLPIYSMLKIRKRNSPKGRFTTSRRIAHPQPLPMHKGHINRLRHVIHIEFQLVSVSAPGRYFIVRNFFKIPWQKLLWVFLERVFI